MKPKPINQLFYIALIAVTLICVACFDGANVTIITPPDEVEPEPLPTGEGLTVGVTAPAFSLPDADGNTHSLADYAGKNVVLVFYRYGG